MAKTNFPKSATGFNIWFTNFQKAFNANYKAYGFTAKDVRQMNQWFKTWQQSYEASTSFNEFQKIVTKNHNFQWHACQSMIEGFWAQITKNSKFHGNVQAWFGPTATNVKVAKPTLKKVSKPARAKSAAAIKSIGSKPVTTIKRATTMTIKKTAAKKKVIAKKPATKRTTTKPIVLKNIGSKPIRTSPRATSTKATPYKNVKRTTKKPTAKKTTTIKPSSNGKMTHTSIAPFVWFTSGSKKGTVNVYVGSTKNGGFGSSSASKPACIEYRNANGKWSKLTQGTNFPFIHTVASYNRKVYYRACWITNGKKGSWSPSVSYTFGVKVAA